MPNTETKNTETANTAKNNKRKKHVLFAIGTLAILFIGYLVQRKPNYLESAWSKMGTLGANFDGAKILGSTLVAAKELALTPNTINIGLMAAAPVALYHKYTLPKHKQLEDAKLSHQYNYSEMDQYFTKGLKYLSADKSSDEKHSVKPNYLESADSFRKARMLLEQIKFDAEGEIFKKERQCCCLYNEAVCLFFLGIYSGNERNPLENLNKILEINPKHREALNLRGLIFFKSAEKYQEAKNDFSASLQILPGQNDVYVCSLAAQAQLLKRSEQKPIDSTDLQTIQKAILVHIKFSDPIFTNTLLKIYAEALYDQNNLKDAKKYLDKLYEAIPKNPETYEEQIAIKKFQKKICEQLVKQKQSNQHSATSFSLGSGDKSIDIAQEILEIDKKINALQEEISLKERFFPSLSL